MIFESSDPSQARATRIAVFISDGETPRSAGVEGLRVAAIEALQAMGVRIVLTTHSNLAHYIEVIGPDRGAALFADSPAVLRTARKIAGPDRRDLAYCLFVSPSSFADWAAPWAKGLEAVPGENTVYFTDSALSRTVVENHLSGSRADVRILAPRGVDGSAAVPTTFDVMKEWQPGGAISNYSGSDWKFSARTEAHVDAREDRTLEERIQSNISVLGRIVEGRPLGRDGLHIGILGHKLSFIDELARDLGRHAGSTIELDEWEKLSAPSDTSHSEGLISRSDVVIGEWGRPNNVWIQKRAAPGKRLIVRVHRYEVTTEFPRAIDMDRFDAGVVIVPWVGRALVQKFGWPAEKMVYIPNYVNTRYFRRPKLPGAEFTLGLVGMTPDLKRIDLALDLLVALRTIDLRYSLRVRGQLPPSHIHWSTNPRIAEQWEKVLFRLRVDPQLRNSVTFDPPGRDMAAWFEGVGVILSTSDLEGSHVALAEGVASGALPIARPWPGIRTLWPAEFVFDDVESAAEQVLKSRNAGWRAETISRLIAHPSLDQDRVLKAWGDLVRGDLESAQSAFGPVDWSTDWYEPVQE